VSVDPLDLGGRLAQLLATGRRISTYKLATLDALLQHCLENPVSEDASLRVSLHDVAGRVVEAYWPQVRVFGVHGVLRQMQPGRPGAVSLIDTVTKLRQTAEKRGLSTAAQFRAAEPTEWAAVLRKVAVTLARQPILRLQKTGGREPGVAFLYDDSWLSDDVSLRILDAHDWSLELFPGVPSALARLSPMLQPVVQQWWVADVQRLNSADLEIPDLHAFLFDTNRIAVARLAPGLREHQDNRCFYCRGSLSRQVHVDHVLPWSRVAIDGLRNLVLADARCNGDKSATLPAVDHVARALARGEEDLVEVAKPLRWPVETERVIGAARGLYRATSTGSPLWRQPGLYDFWAGQPLPA
jgi:hypothetical protein